MFLTGCVALPDKAERKEYVKQDGQYVKSVWLSYYEFSQFTMEHSEEEFEKEVSASFKNLSKKGFTRISVHVRPFADAMYNSSYFPVSAYFGGMQGSKLNFDPLEIMCRLGKKYKLEIEAWINPYRVSNDSDFTKLSSDNAALEWQDTDNILVLDKGIYFNPYSKQAQELIINGVKEIAQNYEISSICFDDYFYPSNDYEIDKTSYDEYVSAGGDLTQGDWRRENVNNLIKEVYSSIKGINENIYFGISPAANIDNDYENLYADVSLWCSEEGYIDYINPQIYFGFQNENQPFMSTVKEWIKTAGDKTLYVSLPLYKTGTEDEFAGSRGVREFVENNNIISRQITYLSKLEQVNGYYIFSYSFLSDESEEVQNIYSAMQ